jgi:hypothetical protein
MFIEEGFQAIEDPLVERFFFNLESLDVWVTRDGGGYHTKVASCFELQGSCMHKVTQELGES